MYKFSIICKTTPLSTQRMARGRECFVGQSILLDNDSTMLSERSTRMGETSTTPWLSSRKVIIIIKKPILKIFKFKYK